MSNQLVGYLNRAANGQIPGMFIMQLMMLELPNLMSLLLPLGFYVSVLVAYGRLYAENEMIVLQACGYGPNQLLKHTLIMALVVASLVLVMMVWLSPLIATERAHLLRTSGVQVLIKTIVPGRFNALNDGKQIFYIEEMDRDKSKAENAFFAFADKHDDNKWGILWADKGVSYTDADSNEDYITLERGHFYQGVPGQALYQVMKFDRYNTRLPHPDVSLKEDMRTVKTARLLPFNNPDKAKAAELQWRFSIPLMVVTLALLAVPLSRVNPRSGKFAKLLPAILLFIIYANLMFVIRDWLTANKIPLWLGVWWLHALAVFLGVMLMWRNKVSPA